MNLYQAVGKIKEQWDRFFETVEKPCSCIYCQGTRIYWNGQRERTASIFIEEEVVYLTDILCKRVKCANPGCKKSWTLRPPGLMPRRHYQLCIVAHGTDKFLLGPHVTLTSIAYEYQCSRRTVCRWLNWISDIAEPPTLIDRLFSVSKELPFTTVLKVFVIIRKINGACKRIFQRAAKNFYILEALGMAYQYYPPGFRGMIETTISNRDRVTTYHRPFIPELAQ